MQKNPWQANNNDHGKSSLVLSFLAVPVLLFTASELFYNIPSIFAISHTSTCSCIWLLIKTTSTFFGPPSFEAAWRSYGSTQNKGIVSI
jgi:hypothetical protein